MLIGTLLLIAIALWFVHWLTTPERSSLFFDELEHGLNLRPDNPVYHLRERLLLDRRSKAKLPQLEILALFFKAWIHYRDGKPLRRLSWKSDGPSPERFPSITEAAR